MSNKAPQTSDYRMPVPYRGQLVLYYEGGVRNEDRACPAIVKAESHSSLHLHVFGQDNQFDVTCVRHLDDPNTKEWDKIENGGWDFNFHDRARTSTVQDVKLVGAK